MTKHPNRDQLTAFLAGQLQGADQATIENHVESCDVCCDAMSQLPPDTLNARLRSIETDQDALLPVPKLSQPSTELPSEIPAALIDHPRYRILGPLGKGGMGVVYKAEHRMMDRVVALKVIDRRFTENLHAIERFRNEVKAAAKLSHPNIVHAYDAEQAEDLHFLVMEFVDGISLADLVRRKGPLPVSQGCGIIRKVAHGLQHASQQDMVHRDIKPQNIMVTKDGKVRILDFGLARLVREFQPSDHSADESLNSKRQSTHDALTLTGSVLGTPDYMAPEQVFDAHKADIRADIYSLGCTFYFLLTGNPPYSGQSTVQKLVAHSLHTPSPVKDVRTDVPANVLNVVERMMAREAGERYQTPSEVATAIEDCLKATSPESRSPGKQSPRSGRSVEKPETESVVRKNSQSILVSRRNVGILIFVFVAASISVVLSRTVVDDSSLPTPARQTPVSLEKTTGSPEVVSDTDGWVDQIPLIDPKVHAVNGQWRRIDSELHVASKVSAMLALPKPVPSEYDFEVTFTRRTGRHSIALVFLINGHQATFDIDAWGQNLMGIQRISKLDLQSSANPTRAENAQLKNNRRYTVKVSVRSDRVDAFWDGESVATYMGDGSNLSLIPEWNMPDAHVIGVGAYASGTTFHRIRVRPLSPDRSQ